MMGMYEEFYGFRTKPFELVPNPDFIYLSGTHKKAAAYLDYGIREKIGFILVTGEVGSGKTTIIRDLIKKLDTRVHLSKVFNTKVGSEQLLAMINDDFGIDVKGRDKVMLLKDLNDFLIDQYAKGNHSVLIIDEAQNLTADLLEEVRMLSNLETDRTKLLQIILVGQPELRKTLAQPELRQLRQRISISCNILPLTNGETLEYILHRLEVAGNRQAVTFLDGTIDVIHAFSRGIPRFVNIICDFIMLAAFVEEKREISVELVNEVISSTEMENGYWQDEPLDSPVDNKDEKAPDLMVRLENLENEILRANKLLSKFASMNLDSFELKGLEDKSTKTLGKTQDCLHAGRRALINELMRTRWKAKRIWR